MLIDLFWSDDGLVVHSFNTKQIYMLWRQKLSVEKFIARSQFKLDDKKPVMCVRESAYV